MVRRRPWYRPARPIDYLLVIVPVAIALELFHASPPLVFIASAVAIIPLAGVMGRATERLAERAGPGIGGLLNATFGNAAELIIAAVGLARGLGDIVKASLTGSILGNILLVLGLSLLAGGLRHSVQRFNRSAASMGTTLLALSAIGMIVPSLFWYAVRDQGAGGSRAGSTEAAATLGQLERGLSVEIAVVLGIVYVLSLVFALRTHKHLYAGDTVAPNTAAESHGPGKTHAQESIGGSVALLLIASGAVAVLSEILVGSLEPTAKALGLTDLFVGVVVVAVVGNAAEHASAVFAARRNDVDLAFHIAVGSSLQIALFVTPLLLFLSFFVGPHPIDLHFTMFEVGSVTLAVFAVNLVAQDGESNWMEGVMLLAVYAVLGIAFYFLPA